MKRSLFETQPTQLMETAFASAGIRLMRVDAMVAGSSTVAKCQLYYPAVGGNTETIGTQDYQVRVFTPKNSGDHIYVLAPEGGTDTINGSDAVPYCEVAAASAVIGFQITATATGGGNYTCKSLSGSASGASGTGSMTAPIGMTVSAANDVIALNLAENGGSSHVLAISSYHFGLVVGVATNGFKVAVFDVTPLPAPTADYQVITALSGAWLAGFVRAHS